VITVDKNPAYPPAFATLQQVEVFPATCTPRSCKYLNNVVGQDRRFVN
jgi:transposase-like protein